MCISQLLLSQNEGTIFDTEIVRKVECKTCIHVKHVYINNK